MSERPFFRKKIEKEDARMPFIIRGHHLPIYRDLAQKTLLSPSDQASDKAREMRDATLYELSPVYTTDMFGSTQSQHEKTERSLQNLFTEFINLPKDHPVSITEGKKDDLCKRCPTIGNHCTLNDVSEYDGTHDMFSADKVWLERFLRAKGRRLLTKTVIEKNVTDFTDSPPQTARVVKSTAGETKSILSKWDLLSDYHFYKRHYLKLHKPEK